MTTIVETSDADHLRMVLPVLADYVESVVEGANLRRLRDAALRGKAIGELALIDALIAAGVAIERLQATVELGGTVRDYRIFKVAIDAIGRATEADGPYLSLATREAMAHAVLDDLAARGYAITYVGGGSPDGEVPE